MISSKLPLIKKKIEPANSTFIVHMQANFGSFNKMINNEVEHLPRKR
jgi:hypothetical protein